MRAFFAFIFAASLAACALGPQTQLYRPHGDAGPAWPISGDFNFLTHHLQVFVNGEQAAAGNIFSQASRTITGDYAGHSVRAECVDYPAYYGGILMVLCDVFIDGEHAALLTFD